jgi:hypothetical protein
MRHDKEAFAGQSMAAARIGKLIGDDVRILVFSAYLDALAGSAADAARVHRLLDPFSGCFASATPRTVVLLRVALRTLHLHADGDARGAREYSVIAARRVAAALVAEGDVAITARELERERAAWNDYYAALDALEAGQPDLRARALQIMDGCRVSRAEAPRLPAPSRSPSRRSAPSR